MYRQSGFSEKQFGFTLVELILVITIMGLMAAMILPVAFHVDEDAKEKETLQTFEAIRMAILGPRNAFDAEGNLVIGGYVGDVGHLPKLYIFEWDDSNKKWTHPHDNGRQDDDGNDLPDITANNTGTVVGDDNAMPAALWKKTLPGGYPADALEEDGWNGPYLPGPKEKFPDDQVWGYDGTGGDDDQDRRFLLRECEGRISDGWGRALIIYVEDGTDADSAPDMDGENPLNLVFVSAGPDGQYTASDPTDESLTHNDDNLVFRIEQNEWDDSETKTQLTRNLFLEIREAIIGDSPNGINDGFTGDVCRLPKMFRWYDNGTPADETDDFWDDDQAAPPTPPATANAVDIYTKGQPRELWTQSPNTIDMDIDGTPDDDVLTAGWENPSIGWPHAYLQKPWETGENAVIRDAWDREVLFFWDQANNAMLMLSRGADGKFDFYTTNSDNTEPDNFVEEIDLSAASSTPYDPNDTNGYNADNIVMYIRSSDWDVGIMRLDQFAVENAYYNDTSEGTTKAALFYDFYDHDSDGMETPQMEIFSASADGNWSEGPGTPPFNRNIRAGTRAIVFWNDADNDDMIDIGEDQYNYLVNIESGRLEEITTIEIDTTTDFSAAQ